MDSSDMTPLPESIKIGPMHYSVETREGLRSAKDQLLLGQIDFEELKIKLDASMRQEVQAVVFWHEIMHGVLYQAGRPEWEDERLIDALAYGMVDLLHNGCDLLEYINRIHWAAGCYRVSMSLED